MIPDPGALNILLDVYSYHFDQPAQQAVLQIWGVNRSDISQARNFTNCSIELKVGFQRGLPLNKPAQAGTILKGKIAQSFGNWQGTAQTLDFVIITEGSTVEGQGWNIVFNWIANTSLSAALASTLTNAFPGVAQDIKIDNRLVLNHDEVGVYSSIPPLAETLREITRQILGADYDGITITRTAAGFVVRDSYKAAQAALTAAPNVVPAVVFKGSTYPISNSGTITIPASVYNDPSFGQAGGVPFSGVASNPNGTYPISGVKPNNQTASSQQSSTPAPSSGILTQTVKPVAFEDLIGQVTWIQAYEIIFTCPMRSDIAVNDLVQLPAALFGTQSSQGGLPGAVTQTADSLPSSRNNVVFTGKFIIREVHHVGNFRQADGQSWVTVFRANPHT